MSIPTLIVAGTHSGSGKTTVTLAIIEALVRRGLVIQAFKVGPDFLDTTHLSNVTGRPARNLDTWMMGIPPLVRSFERAVVGADLAIIEGVMGLFDGRGPVDESGSTADLARLGELPVLLSVEARGMARSIAPLVRGFSEFDPAVQVAGVIANRVGSRRHYEAYLKPALMTAVPQVEPLGFLGRDPALALPSRHLGLVPSIEVEGDTDRQQALVRAAEVGLNLRRIQELARIPSWSTDGGSEPSGLTRRSSRVRIAVARDLAFCFYYEDNLDRFRDEGAEIVTFSPLADRALPEGVDLVYLGGGYPELHAAQLAENAEMRASLRAYHASGKSILAECGGLMACCRTLRDGDGQEFPMWDLIPAVVSMQPRFAALGYVTTESTSSTLWGPVGTRLRGHEFHYSTLRPLLPLDYTTRLLRSDESVQPDGIRVGGLLASYAHVHLGSDPAAARRILDACGQGW